MCTYGKCSYCDKCIPIECNKDHVKKFISYENICRCVHKRMVTWTYPKSVFSCFQRKNTFVGQSLYTYPNRQ